MLSAVLLIIQGVGTDKLQQNDTKSSNEQQEEWRQVGRSKGKSGCKVAGWELFSLSRERREELILSVTT